jgi:hypothetical protein
VSTLLQELQALFKPIKDLPLTYVRVTSDDAVPLLEMRGLPDGEDAPLIVDDVRAQELMKRADALAGSIPARSILGGKTFEELDLYEKKSALVNRELECVRRIRC